MSRFLTYSQILDKKIPDGRGISVVKGSSLTIPGQGCDLMQIIESVVKLPPLDERTFDVPTGQDPDVRFLQVQLDLENVYQADGVALAEEALARRKAKETAKESKEQGANADVGEGQAE